MKKVIRNGLLAVTMILAVNSMEAKTANTEVSPVSADLDYIKGGSKITIKDANNKIVYSEIIENSITTSDEYQLPNLGQGTYTLEIEHAFEILIRPFEVMERSTKFYSDQSYSIFKPVITTKGKQLFLSKLSLNQESFDVLVYDFKGDLLHKEQISNEVEMNRIYDFSEIGEDKFNVVIQSKDRTFTQSIKF